MQVPECVIRYILCGYPGTYPSIAKTYMHATRVPQRIPYDTKDNIYRYIVTPFLSSTGERECKQTPGDASMKTSRRDIPKKSRYFSFYALSHTPGLGENRLYCSVGNSYIPGGGVLSNTGNAINRVFGGDIGWVGFLVVCFLYKTNANPRKIIRCGKKWPKCHF